MRQAPLLFVPPDASSWTPPAPPDLSRYPTIDLDSETTGVSWPTGDRPVGLAVGAPAAGATWYLPWGHRGGGNLCEETVKRWAQRELRGKRIRNLYTKFDLHMLRVWGVDLREQDNTFHDVAHSAALLDDRRKSFSLDALAQAELGVGKAPLPALAVEVKDAIADLPAGAVAAYAMRDVELVARLADVYAPRLEAEHLHHVSQLEDDVIPAVVEIEANGMPLDMDLLTEWIATSQRLIEAHAFDLYRHAGFTINPDAPTDLVRLFRLCGEPIAKTLTGAPSFTAPVMQAAAERHEAIRLAWRLGKLRDLRSKYLVQYQKAQVQGVLYPTLNQLPTDEGGTISGRFSCVKPNLQQVMGQDKHDRMYRWLAEAGGADFLIKRLFRPASGVWCSADMKQVEYRLFVHFTESERLIQRYRDDPHVSFHHIVGGFVHRVRPDMDYTRIKVYNFLSIFGGGVGAAALNLGLSREEAADLSETYHAEFPEARRLLDKAADVARVRGYVKSILGRRTRFPEGERLHKALNAVVQPSAADANKLALVAVYRERRRLGLTMRMTVHDSLESDLADPGLLPAYREVLNTQRLALSVPLLWDVKTGPTWATCH